MPGSEVHSIIIINILMNAITVHVHVAPAVNEKSIAA